MNLVFWGQERHSGTTAHMMAVTGMLRALCGEECVVTGRFIREQPDMFALCDCGTGLKGRRRHFLWHADLVVVNLKQENGCVEQFFEENFHIAKNLMFLFGGYDCEENADMAYLNRIYRIESERIGIIPYNSEFGQAIENGVSDVFIAKELCAPTSYANEQFIRSLQTAVTRMMSGIGYEFNRKELSDRRMKLWNRL